MENRNQLVFIILIVAIAFAVFANSLGGEFVYDDKRQIVRNPLIQDSTLYGKALTSDVWAFKGDGNLTASNYWRPTFTAWSIINFQLFGANPFGWHFLNILLHAGICVLIFVLLRRWNLSQILAFAVALVFAVHPVHTESVAWISGSPDLLFALAFLASLWFADKWATDRNGSLFLVISLVLYALALGAKEVAFLCFPIYFLIFNFRKAAKAQVEAGSKKSKKRAQTETAENTAAENLNFSYNHTVLFLAVAAVYFLLRWTILGRISFPGENNELTFFEAILTAPVIFVFYLKQMIFPVSLAANYSLAAVTEIGFSNFILPLIISLAALILFWLLAKRSFVQKIGFALLILPLLPAFNITAFQPEQFVHDRYLYLPLLGFLLLIFPFLQESVQKFSVEKSESALLVLAMLISLPLAAQTFFYNRVWTGDLSLWEHTVKADPRSSFSFSQYGSELSELGRYEEAIGAYNNSLEIKPTPLGHLGRGRNRLLLKQYDAAVQDLRAVIDLPDKEINAYTLYQAYEALALALSESRKLEQAETVLREARKRLPIYSAALTEKLAVVLYQQNRKTEVLQELESARQQAKTELLPESKSVYLRLGMLYQEAGQNEKARQALQEYLNLTRNLRDQTTTQNRAAASNLLKNLK